MTRQCTAKPDAIRFGGALAWTERLKTLNPVRRAVINGHTCPCCGDVHGGRPQFVRDCRLRVQVDRRRSLPGEGTPDRGPHARCRAQHGGLVTGLSVVTESSCNFGLPAVRS